MDYKVEGGRTIFPGFSGSWKPIIDLEADLKDSGVSYATKNALRGELNRKFFSALQDIGEMYGPELYDVKPRMDQNHFGYQSPEEGANFALNSPVDTLGPWIEINMKHVGEGALSLKLFLGSQGFDKASPLTNYLQMIGTLTGEYELVRGIGRENLPDTPAFILNPITKMPYVMDLAERVQMLIGERDPEGNLARLMSRASQSQETSNVRGLQWGEYAYRVLGVAGADLE